MTPTTPTSTSPSPPRRPQASSEPLQIPVGLTCTVTEPDVPDGWALAGIAPDGGQVTIGTEPSEVTITNTRVQGSLVVQKVTEGAALGAGTEFAVDVDCSDGFSDTVDLDVGDQGAAFEVIDGIASGSTCTITEDDPPDGWELVDITPNPVVIGTDETAPAVVTVTNRRETGRLDIVKQAVGPIAGAGQNFTVHLDCPGDQYDTDLTMRVPGDNGDTTATVGGIPTGVECTITETDLPDGWTLTGIEPEPGHGHRHRRGGRRHDHQHPDPRRAHRHQAARRRRRRRRHHLHHARGLPGRRHRPGRDPHGHRR